MKKIIRTSTVALSLDVLLKGQLAYLSESYDVIAVSGEDENLETVRNREKVKTISVSMERDISIFQDLNSLLKLYRVFKAEKPQIVHSITPKAGLLSMLAAKLSGVPIRIHTFTGLIFPSKTGLMQKLLIQIDKVLCWAATHIYPEGNGVKQDLIYYKITKKSLKVLANGNVNGIDIAYFSTEVISGQIQSTLKSVLGIRKIDFVYVFVGRMVSDKGINELVFAFKFLVKNHDNLKLLLVGSFESELDPLDQMTLQEIERNPMIISVDYQQDVRPYFAISDALVFPSYREGFPNVVMQAGAMGLPSIVTDINGSNEIIQHQVNGLIIPSKDTVSLIDAMSQLLSSDSTMTLLSSNARKMIVERYERQEVWKALLTEYQSLLSQLDDQGHV